MRTMNFLLAALAVAAAAPALAQTAPPAPTPTPAPPARQSEERRWLSSDTQTVFVPARIAFPLQIGTLSARRTQEFSRQGEGLDNAVQYASADNQVFATVYLYYPGLPHAGVAAFATDTYLRTAERATRIQSPLRTVAAGGAENVALRIDYANYRGLASSAAFIKAGRWIVKLRVSGPEARRAEVEAAMADLLRGAEFGRGNEPMTPHLLTVSDCPGNAGRTAARLLPDPPGAEIAAHGLLATFDGGGIQATGEGGARRDLPPRVPDQLCRGQIHIGGRNVDVLRGEAGPPLSVDGRTRLLVPLNDAGLTLEVVQADNLHRYLVLYHEIGRTTLLGGYDNVPSDDQIAGIFDGGPSEANRIRVPVQLRTNGGTEMAVPSPSGGERRNGTN